MRAEELDLPDLESGTVTSGTGARAVNLHYMARGEGRLILLLHGFPQYWYAWRHQLADLGNEYRAVALDLRGYNDSDKPAGRHAYRMHLLVEDVANTIRHLAGPQGRAVLVGHDWGGVIAWAFALRHPELLDKLVICNAPHPARMRDELRRRSQLSKSWYMFFFQLPVLPEVAMTAGRCAAVGRAVRDSLVDKTSVTDEEIDHYRAAFGRPGVATAAINYYRNLITRRALRGSRRPSNHQRITAPTLLIWGEQDRALGVQLATRNEEFVEHLTVLRLPNAGHFVQEERPREVNEAIRTFLTSS